MNLENLVRICSISYRVGGKDYQKRGEKGRRYCTLLFPEDKMSKVTCRFLNPLTEIYKEGEKIRMYGCRKRLHKQQVLF